MLLEWLILSRIRTYVPLWETSSSHFQGSVDVNSLIGPSNTYLSGSVG